MCPLSSDDGLEYLLVEASDTVPVFQPCRRVIGEQAWKYPSKRPEHGALFIGESGELGGRRVLTTGGR